MLNSGIARKFALFSIGLLWTAPVSFLMAESPISVQQIDRPNGRLEIQVTNHSHVPVTALLAVGVRSLRGSDREVRSARFFDVALEPTAAPLDYQKAFTFTFFGPQPPVENLAVRSAQLKAAIFADGSTWGDDDSVQILLNRRRVAYACDADALQAAMDAKMHRTGSGALLERLDDLKSHHMAEAKSSEERTIIDAVFAEAKLKVEEGIQRSTNSMGNPGVLASSLSVSQSAAIPDLAVKQLVFRMQRIDSVRPKSHD